MSKGKVKMDLFIINKLKEYFYESFDGQTSVYLFGSAATGNWVAGRSDLDLIVIMNDDKMYSLGSKVRDWTWSSDPVYPVLDGFLISSKNNSYSFTRLDSFLKVNFPSDTCIDIMDQWMIKNRSIHLFGSDVVGKFFPEIGINQLSLWAKENLRDMIKSNPDGLLSKHDVVLSKEIWTISWFSRMLLLSKGEVCESKREALLWFANEFSEVKEIVTLLLDDYFKSDADPAKITADQSLMLRRFCFDLLFSGKYI